MSRSAVPHLLDLGERAAVLLLFALLCGRMLGAPSHEDRLLGALFVAGESVPVLLVLIRRPARSLSLRPGDWTVALLATVAPLLVRPGGGALLPALWCGSLILLGFAFQLWAKLALGRSFGLAPAHRGLADTGPYTLVRHPAYAGYLMMDLGYCLANASRWNLAIYAAAYTAQLLRILAEERLLEADPHYRSYRARVRWRLLPGLF